MRGGKLVLSVVVLVIIAFGIGFGWAASGRSAAERARDDAKQELDLAAARGYILEARVSLYNVNFGDAQRQLDDAKAPLTRARDHAQADGKKDMAGNLSTALTDVQDAQRLAARLDQGANSRANDALTAMKTATGSK